MTSVDWPILKILTNLDFLQTLLLGNLETSPSQRCPQLHSLYPVQSSGTPALLNSGAFFHPLLSDIVEHSLPETLSYLASGTLLSLGSPLTEVGLLLSPKADAS